MNESSEFAQSRLAPRRASAEWMFPLGTIALVIFASLYIKHLPQTSSDVASWVQAVGTIAAIGAAIWISNKQYRDSITLEQIRRDAAEQVAQEEVEAFIQAVKEEIGTLWDGFNLQVGPTLEALQDGQMFALIFPGSTEAFTIYHGNTPMVGKISDPTLRRQIVETYAIAHGVIYSLQLNNKMLGDLEQLTIFYHQPDRDLVLDQKRKTLIDYAQGLKNRYGLLSLRVNALMVSDATRRLGFQN